MSISTLFPDFGPLPLPSATVPTTLPSFRGNAHIHLPPNFSAFDTVTQAVELAAQQELDYLGASNYYDYAVYSDFAKEAVAKRLFPLFGLEIIALIDDLRSAGIKINDPGNPGKMYICGKGISRFDPMTETAAELLAVIRRNDSERIAQMTAKLAEVFKSQEIETGLDAAAIIERIATRHHCDPATVYLQERHLAQAFQEVLFEKVKTEQHTETLNRLFGTPSKSPDDAPMVQAEIRSHLMKAGKAAFVEETFVGFDHAYQLVLALGGIPCYPTLADGANPICPFEESPEGLVEAIRGRGIYAAEFIPVRNVPDVLSRYVMAMRSAGIVVTAGTEHNTLDLIPMEPMCLKDDPIPAEIAAIFREGACVVAAHQYLTMHGEPGFVDADGRPNPAYATDEERIKTFANIGAELLERFKAASPVSPTE
jgi:hypothetical protein